MAKSGCMALLLIGVVASLMVCSMAQTVHVVGDSMGWIIPTGNTDLYDNWADNKTFRVGDILTFNFTTNNHDVVEVTEANYDACTSTNMIGSIITTGPANITLTSIGEHYYICTIGAGRHCQAGQKLDITVIAAAPGSTAPPSQSPTPSQSPAPTPGSSVTPSPSQSPPTNGPTSPTTPGSTTPSPSQSPSSNGPTSSTTPGSMSPPAATTPTSTPGSSSSVVLGSVFVTFMSIAMGVFF